MCVPLSLLERVRVREKKNDSWWASPQRGSSPPYAAARATMNERDIL